MSNQLQQIFKTNPEAQQIPEVQNLITFMSKRFEIQQKQLEKYRDFHDKVMLACLHSEVIVRDGQPGTETVHDIMELLEEI